MRVEFGKTVLQRISDAVHAALAADRKIERIVISETERRRLERETYVFRDPRGTGRLMVFGVRVDVEPDAAHIAD